MNAMSRSFVGLAAAALVAAGVSACGSDDDPPAKAAARTQAGPAIQSADLLRAVSRKTYVGRVAGTDAYIGGDRAREVRAAARGPPHTGPLTKVNCCVSALSGPDQDLHHASLLLRVKAITHVIQARERVRRRPG